MNFVRTDRELETPLIDAELARRGGLVLLPDGVAEDKLADEVAEADVLLMCYTPVTARVIGAARRLKAIVKYGVGIDAIDMAAAMERGIPVVNIPEYAEDTVAEGAFAMMIALAKKLIPLDRQMQAEGWAWPTARWMGQDIAGKTVGIVGLGRIGRSFARMAGQGFRARVIAYNPGMPAADMAALGVEKIDDLHDLLAQSDFVSLHCTLNDTTRHIIGAVELAAMKPTAFLINSSRGALVDEAALVAALTQGRIAGAGLDVFSAEPLSTGGHLMSPLFSLPNVLMLPHLTFYTAEAMERLERETIERCDEALSGRPVLVKSHDPRLRAQTRGVRFE
ncbi:C-terminal binding protein [Defluviimonas sp. WL0002]|uniref:C-terminal binding protein n=1 Tax=Albidovulum marisflavi TaxID=2984159 RepID=A0ABT2ZBA7_9RHOB|nr:C-terminal binding protein [Defluviimonas sp. WL0002]MCV2868360.1 C-terminal binding protein [Defluviimonas sp. WL0002]